MVAIGASRDLKVAMFHNVFEIVPRAVLLQDDAEVEEGGGVLLRGISGSAAEYKVPDLPSARPVSKSLQCIVGEDHFLNDLDQRSRSHLMI